MITEQKYLKKPGTIILTSLLSVVAPLSMDMYMPALPKLTAYFNTSVTLINFTLYGFFLFMAVGLLFSGTLSDKYGRKPVLLTSLSLYIIASLICAFAQNIGMLIIARVFEALGAGGMVAIATALIKDSFTGRTRDAALSITQALAMIGPMVAPIVGALILKVAGWRTIFYVLAAVIFVGFLLGLMLQESLSPTERNTGSVFSTIKRLTVVAKNKSFTYYLITASLMGAPTLAYIAASSYVYESFFHLSAQGYSYFFAANACFAVMGATLYLPLKRRFLPKQFMTLSLTVLLTAVAAMFLFGLTSPWIFLITLIPVTLIGSIMRPFSTSILFDQQEGDTGSASSLINFIQTLFGAMGMLAGSLPWPNQVRGLAGSMLFFLLCAAVCWLLLLKAKTIRIKGLTD